MPSPLPLTHDMKKAAERAFHGHPPDPQWTRQARAVYDGIVAAKRPSESPPEPVTGTPFTDASPFVPPSLQVWHVQYSDREEHTLLLLPAHADTEFVLQIARTIAEQRPFTVQPLRQGHFAVQWPTDPALRRLFVFDTRVLDHTGCVRIPSQS